MDYDIHYIYDAKQRKSRNLQYVKTVSLRTFLTVTIIRQSRQNKA